MNALDNLRGVSAWELYSKALQLDYLNDSKETIASARDRIHLHTLLNLVNCMPRRLIKLVKNVYGSAGHVNSRCFLFRSVCSIIARTK